MFSQSAAESADQESTADQRIVSTSNGESCVLALHVMRLSFVRKAPHLGVCEVTRTLARYFPESPST